MEEQNVKRIDEFFNETSKWLTDNNMMPDDSIIGDLVTASSVVHFTHNDADAVGSDLVLRSFIYDGPEISTVFCNTTEAMKNFRNTFLDEDFEKWNDTVLIFSDIGIASDEDLQSLADACQHFSAVLFVDHHKTNKMMDNKIFEIFPQNVFHLMVSEIDGIPVSATWLMLILFSNIFHQTFERREANKELIRISYEISNYDTYNFKNRTDLYLTGNERLTSDLIDAGVWNKEDLTLNEVLSRIVEWYDCIAGTYNDVCYETLQWSQQVQLQQYAVYKKNEIKALLEKVHVVKFDHTIPELDGLTANVIAVANCPFSNELMEVLYKTPEYADNAIVIYVDNMMLSFRSSEIGTDVSAWAKKLGGGGHAHAAGAYLKDADLFFNILKYCILSPKLSKEGVDAMKEFSKSIIK